MSGLEALHSRFRAVYREIAKFGAVGAVGVIVNILAFNLARHVTDLPVVRCSVIATAVAIAFNYLGFRYFTYRDREKSGRTKELGLFLFFSGIGLVIENGVLYTATYGLDLDSPLQNNVFKFIGIGVATLFRFWSYRSWVFRALPADTALGQAESFLAESRPEAEPEPQVRRR